MHAHSIGINTSWSYYNLNICHLIDHMGLGGAQTMVADLAELHGNSFTLTVLSLRDSIFPQFNARLNSANVAYRSLSLNRRSLAGPWRLRRALAAGEFDLLHVHLDYSNSVGILAALSLPRPRPVIVSQIHASPTLQNSAAFRAIASGIAPYVDAHLVATESLRKATYAALHRRVRRIETIPLGIDIKQFTKNPTPSTLSETLRGGAKRVIGYIGRLVPQKGVDSLLRSVPELLRAEPSTRLLIVGDGPDECVLKETCRSLGIASAVTFTGYLEDVQSVYEALDVFVLPSWHEGFGIVLAEAMAMEVPIVATQSIGIIDVVENGKTALLVPPADSAGLSKAILCLFDDASLRRNLMAAGRQTAESEFSRHRMTRQMEELYDDVLSSRGSRTD